jgi:hypothetical protein
MVDKNSPPSPASAAFPDLTTMSPFGTFVDQALKEELQLDKLDAAAVAKRGAEFASRCDTAQERRLSLLEATQKCLPDSTDGDAARAVIESIFEFQAQEDEALMSLVSCTDELWRRAAAPASSPRQGPAAGKTTVSAAETEQWSVGGRYADGHPRWQVAYDAVCRSCGLADVAAREIEHHQDGEMTGLVELVARLEQLLGAALWALNGPKGEKLETLQMQVYGRATG